LLCHHSLRCPSKWATTRNCCGTISHFLVGSFSHDKCTENRNLCCYICVSFVNLYTLPFTPLVITGSQNLIRASADLNITFKIRCCQCCLPYQWRSSYNLELYWFSFRMSCTQERRLRLNPIPPTVRALSPMFTFDTKSQFLRKTL